MPRYALVRLDGLEVRNVATISSVPAAPPGFRNLVENLTNPALSDWTPGNDPMVGWFWDGGIPAVFTAPPEPVDVPTDMQGIIDKAEAIKLELDKLIAGAGGIQGDPA